MRINPVNNISINNNRPVFKGHRNAPGAFLAGASLRNPEEMDAIVRSYSEASSTDMAAVNIFTALVNKTLKAAEVLNIIKTPEHKARVAALDNMVSEASLLVEA